MLISQNPTSRPGPVRLSLRVVGDLVDAYEPDVLAAMQADAAALADTGGPAADAWRCYATALGEACAIAEYERRIR